MYNIRLTRFWSATTTSLKKLHEVSHKTAGLEQIMEEITATWGSCWWQREWDQLTNVTPSKIVTLMPATSTWVSHWGRRLSAALGVSAEPLTYLTLHTCFSTSLSVQPLLQETPRVLLVVRVAPAGCGCVWREGRQLINVSRNTHSLNLVLWRKLLLPFYFKGIRGGRSS